MSKSTEELLRELQSSGVMEGTTAVARAPKAAPTARPIGKSRGPSTILALIAAIILVAVVGSLPFFSLALYPFGLFVTLLHETGHALAATVTGGGVVDIGVSSNMSGVTQSTGGIAALIAPAGYLGATAAGVGLLLAPLRYSRWVLGACAAVPLAALVYFHPASFFTAAWCAAFALSFGAAAWKLSPRLRGFLQIFLGVEAGLNAFRDLMTLLLINSSNAHIHNDAEAMSQALFLPPIVWSVAWTVLSVVLLVLAVVTLVRRDLSGLRR